MYTNYLTYVEDRTCKHCGDPIADQMHKATEFCERQELPDGSVRCCKDDYHAELKKEKEKPYRKKVAFLKRMTSALDAIRHAYGDTVTLEQLNQYGIELDKAVLHFEEGLPVFSFVLHIVQTTSQNTYKITTHV